MKIIVSDDEVLQLNKLERSVRRAVPDAEIHAFHDPFVLMDWIEKEDGWDSDVAFLDIEMGPVSGIAAAKKLQSFNPRINIVFVTGYDQYAANAFEMRASGYVSKPATEQKIRAEMENLAGFSHQSARRRLYAKRDMRRFVGRRQIRLPAAADQRPAGDAQVRRRGSYGEYMKQYGWAEETLGGLLFSDGTKK